MKKRTLLMAVLLASLVAGVRGQETRENADFKLSVNLYNDKLYDLALEQFRQFVTSYPNTPQGIEARFYLGLAQSKLGKHDDARLTFQNFALAFPDNPRAPEAWWNVAEAYIAMNNFREAGSAFERVKTFHPRSRIAPDALAKAAEYFEKGGDLENTRKVLRALVQEYASSDVVVPARLKLAELSLAENQFELSHAEAKRVVDLTKDNSLKAQGLVVMARALAGQSRYEEAQQALNDVVRNHRPTSAYPHALLLTGSLHKETGAMTEAKEAWTRLATDSLQIPPGMRESALLELGDIHLIGGDAAQALVMYERAVPLGGTRRHEVMLRASIAAERAGALEKAGGFVKRLLQDSSAQAFRREAILKAIRIAVAGKNAQEAVRLTTEFADRYPDDAEIPRLLVSAAQLAQNPLKEYRQALEFSERVLTDHATSPLVDDALYGVATALHHSGSLDEAVERYESLIHRFPSSEFVLHARKGLETIRLFEAKDKEAGLENLALLIGDVIAQQSKAHLAFRLGRIYFEDLKDYGRAADQYGQALQLGLDPAQRPTALYFQGKAYENEALRLSVKAEKNTAHYEEQAEGLFDQLITEFPASEFSEDAAFSALKLRLQSASNAAGVAAMEADFMRRMQNFKRMGAALLEVARRYQSLTAYSEAAQTYQTILRQYSQSAVAPDALFHLGESLASMAENDSAIAVWQEFVSKHPVHPSAAQAAWRLAGLLTEKGNTTDALRLYETIANRYDYAYPERVVSLARARAFFSAGDHASALQHFQLYLRSFHDEFNALLDVPADVWFDMAVCFDRSGDRKEAKRRYATYLMRDSRSDRSGRAYYALAAIARDENNISLATRYLQEASRFSIGTAGEFNPASFEAGELYFKSGDYTQAIARYNEALPQVKNDTLTQLIQARMIVSYFRLNNTREADARSASFIRQFPGLSRYAAEFEYERGMVFLRSGDLGNAKRYFDNVIQRYASTTLVPQALYGNARVAELSEKNEEAKKMYESLLQQYAQDPVALRARLALGNLLYNLEQWDEAGRHFKAILDDEQRSPDLVRFAMNNLILVYKELTLYDGALELTRKYIDRFPGDPELINKRIDIGVLYQRLGYYDQSALHLQTLLENADADTEAEIRYYIGEAYFYKGDYQQAILEFLKVPYLVTRRTKVDWIATSYYMAGQAYEKMSKFDQAITMYRQIVERSGIDATFKTAAQKEIDRVNALVKATK